MQWSVAVANNDVLVQQPGLVAAVLDGCRRSYRHAADNRDEWASFGARHFGITHETMTRSINRELNDLHFDCEIDVEGMEAAMALQQKLGAFKKPMRLEDIVDMRFTPMPSAAGKREPIDQPSLETYKRKKAGVSHAIQKNKSLWSVLAELMH